MSDADVVREALRWNTRENQREGLKALDGLVARVQKLEEEAKEPRWVDVETIQLLNDRLSEADTRQADTERERERLLEILRWVRDGQGGSGMVYVHSVRCDCPVCEVVPRGVAHILKPKNGGVRGAGEPKVQPIVPNQDLGRGEEQRT